MGLEANVGLTIVAHESDTEALSDVFRVTSVNYSLAITDGTGAGQAQVFWGITGTVGTTAISYNLDSLPSDRGNVTVTATKVCMLRNLSTDKHILAGNLDIGGSAAAYNVFPSLDTVTVHEGGTLVSTAADATGFDNTTFKVATIRSSAGTVAFQFIIIGEGTSP